MLEKIRHCGGKIPTVDTCRFVIMGYGTFVYDTHGAFVGRYETEQAAVEAVREQAKSMKE